MRSRAVPVVAAALVAILAGAGRARAHEPEPPEVVVEGAPAPAPASAPAPAPPPASAPPPPSTRITPRLAFQTESAIGASGPFYNHLLGARLDGCFAEGTCLGAYAGYANLKGRSGRVGNVLSYVMLEHRWPLPSRWFVPLRAATGYLPQNGPFARASAGLGASVGNVDVTFDLIAPTLWVTGNEPVLSLDLAAEVAFRF